MPGYPVDTNILLRLSRHDDPQHGFAQAALHVLDTQGADLYFTLQNIAEFWNVCTRPASRNGFGLSIGEANSRLDAIERAMTLLPDNAQVNSKWRQIVLANKVAGVQAHDASWPPQCTRTE